MDDLDIRKHITEIVLERTYPNAVSIEYDSSQFCYWVERYGFSSYPLLNPLKDDAIAFNLLRDYKVLIESTGDDSFRTVICNWNGNPEYQRAVADTLNKAICLVIIKAIDYKKN